jgi:hypothetical protein
MIMTKRKSLLMTQNKEKGIRYTTTKIRKEDIKRVLINKRTIKKSENNYPMTIINLYQ